MIGLLRTSGRGVRSVRGRYGLPLLVQFARSRPRSTVLYTQTSPAVVPNVFAYLSQMNQLWLRSPNSVHPELAEFFNKVQRGEASASPLRPQQDNLPPMGIVEVIRAYQTRGYECANLDPLGLTPTSHAGFLDYRTFGFAEDDLDKLRFSFDQPMRKRCAGVLSMEGEHSLREIIDTLEHSYCGNVGVQYMHIPERYKRNFIREKFEKPYPLRHDLSALERVKVLRRLIHTVRLEAFLARKWRTAKRFGIEGCDAVVPGLKMLVDVAAEMGVGDIVLGSTHRGRVNILASVVRMPLSEIFKQFRGQTPEEAQAMMEDIKRGYADTGDVKYHLGSTHTRTYMNGRPITISMEANPSHLEAVTPVVLGHAHAKQFYSGDERGLRTMPVILHGDAAFCGQGVVYESMHMSHQREFSTGGCVHVIVNNQIGFTTSPHEGRSTPHSTDLGRALGCPVIHANAGDPDAVAYAMKVAVQWRQRFRSDIIIDVIGYRRNGHNEMDQPGFTQPEMYAAVMRKKSLGGVLKELEALRTMPDLYAAVEKINEPFVGKHVVRELQDKEVLLPALVHLYAKQCIEDGLLTVADYVALHDRVEALHDSELAKAQGPESPAVDTDRWRSSVWEGSYAIDKMPPQEPTRVDEDVLKGIGEVLFQPPQGFQPHRSIKRLLDHKLEMCRTGKALDWGCAEMLAYGSLLLEGKHVRLSGQDSQRGTFSHRHAVLHNQVAPYDTWTPLNDLKSVAEAGNVPGVQPLQRNAAEPPTVATAKICNASLNEYGSLGFEYGFSLENPNALVIWEAQFGDFANGAQIIIDQFLSSARRKWDQTTGLTLYLPHGYDGQGPEHSSARVERFLQLCDDDPDLPKQDSNRGQRVQYLRRSNLQVCNVTTPAQFFHVLRRQVHKPWRRPLVLLTPKSMLKDDRVRSDMEDFTGEAAFFHRCLLEQDPEVNATPDADISRVIFCTGKIYYELASRRAQLGIKDVAIIRIEQITPFPSDRIKETYRKYPNAKLVFAQEEPKNMGAWDFITRHIRAAVREAREEDGQDPTLPAGRCLYVGRRAAASPATGYHWRHRVEQQDLIERAFTDN